MSKEKIRQLKSNILIEEASDFPYIFVYKDNYFLAKQYAKKIAQINNKKLNLFDADKDLDKTIRSAQNSLFEEDEGQDIILYITNSFSTKLKINELNNVIVICKNTTLDDEHVYEFDTLEDWQILNYLQTKCSGLSNEECSWLYDNVATKYKNNECIYRLDNEASKINCFKEDKHSQVFRELSMQNGFQDLGSHTIYNLTNAIMKKDYLSVVKILDEIENIDIEPYGLVTILNKNFKQVIDIQLGKNATFESLGMSSKQFNAIKYNCGKYSSSDLIRVFKFITEIDYKLKSGLLDIGNRNLIDYIICKVM